MRNIVVVSPSDESLISQYEALVKTFSQLTPGESVRFDFTNIKWCFPLLVLPIATYLRDVGKEYYVPAGNPLKSYLKTIGFPEGTDDPKAINASSTYIPIGVISETNLTYRESFESEIQSKIYNHLGAVEGAKSAIFQPIGELITNIIEHSNKSWGCIFAQNYKRKQFMDICIVDCGRGLSQGYLDSKNIEYSHAQSIKEAMKGHSIKKDDERGFGLRSSVNIVCKGLAGEFILTSGNASLYNSGDEQYLIDTGNFLWKGVIISYRIPRPSGPINIIPHLE